VPIVLVDKQFWKPLVSWFTKTLIPENKISPQDLEIFKVLDEPEEIVNHIKEKLWI
jgi:predicted Rossmann-fold nucleotide-binding protein